jgi:hypothetical protein
MAREETNNTNITTHISAAATKKKSAVGCEEDSVSRQA